MEAALSRAKGGEDGVATFEEFHRARDCTGVCASPLKRAAPSLGQKPLVMIRVTEQDGGVRFAVKVVPGASRDRVVGALGEALKVAVSKPPEAGAANAAVVALLADLLGVPRASVRIVRGHANARKDVFVAGVRAVDASARIAGG